MPVLGQPPIPHFPVDAHRGVPRNLDEVLRWEEERVVQEDWTVACEGQRYQLDRRHEALSLVRRKVIVRTLRNGRVQLVQRGQALQGPSENREFSKAIQESSVSRMEARFRFAPLLFPRSAGCAASNNMKNIQGICDVLNQTTVHSFLLTVLCGSFQTHAQGVLANGNSHTGSTAVAGEVDSWTFTASAGDRVLLRLGSTTFNPYFTVYAPDGSMVDSADGGFNSSGSGDATLSLVATSGGTYTVLVESHFNGGTGPYGLRYSRLPPDLLVPGTT